MDVCCEKCTKSGSFQHVVDLDNIGITILKYVADFFQSELKLGEISSVRNIYDHHKNNIFIIINNNREDSNIKEISSDDIQPKFDISKVSCPRCRYRAEKALNLLKSKSNLEIDDVKGICDHCKAQVSQKPCAICEETVKKFLEETNAKERTDKSIWYKQRISHIHRPLSSDRRIKKIHHTDTTKSGIDTLLDLKFEKALRTKTDLYKPLLVPPKHQLTLKKSPVERSSRDTPRIYEFPSDESVITSFITTFSHKDHKERSFKYVFPEEKVETRESIAVGITSSELIKMTHDRERQKTKEKYEEKLRATKAKTGEIEPMFHKVKLKTSEKGDSKSDSQYFKDKESEKGEVKPQSSGIKSARSVTESKKSKVRPRSSETKTTRSAKESGKGDVRPGSSEIKTTKGVKGQPSHDTTTKGSEHKKELTPQDQVIKNLQQDAKQPSQYVEAKKGEKRDVGKKPTPQDIKTKTGKSQLQDLKTKTGKQEVETTKEKSPSPDVKLERQGAEKTVLRGDTEKQKVDKSQLKEAKKTVKPPQPPLGTKQKTKDLDKEEKRKKPGKEKPELQEDIKQVSRMGGKKIPPSMMLPKPTTKETKGTKGVEVKEKPPTMLKKDVKPPKPPKPKKDGQIKTPTDTKVDEVPMKSKATQAKEAENRRKERKLLAKSPNATENQDETKEEKHEIKKEDDSNKKKEDDSNKNTLTEKEKKKGSKVEKEDEKDRVEPPKKEPVFDILKFLPPRNEPIIKCIDLLAAVKQAEQRMKDMEVAGYAAARKETEKRVALAELPKGEHFLFKIQANYLPEMDEKNKRKKLKDLHLSTVQMKTMKMRGPSFDDLVLKMVRLGRKATQSSIRSNKIQRPRKEGKYKIRSAKRKKISLWSLTIDSEVELEIDRLAHIVKVQHIADKIKGPKIVKNIPDKEKPKLQPDPIVFHKNHEEDPQVPDVEATRKVSESLTKGITRYSLSNPKFIEKGWTVLPTMKVVRKMNIYKMHPAYPEFDWFNYNKKRKHLTYDSGEKLADFDVNGRGRWYYKNGRIALDYYDSEDIHAQQRFVLYSSGEEEEHCRPLTTVLGLFDYLGNGVVFDYAGKIRVKYNQSEGVLLDNGIGPSSRWKWHSLNDPPVLKQVMINTFSENPDPGIQEFEDDFVNPQRIDEQMLAIEMDNVIKEKTKMQKQKFQQFQIKMKALRINKQFSLKILDQAHVYLYFRDGTVNMKLNLGMVLDHHEIIDTDTADIGDVSHVLEKFPPQTDSIVNIQNKLEKIRRCDRERTNHLMRLRTILPVSSADKLIQAKSKPVVRPPLSAACACDDDPYAQRKPPKTNLYYNTRLI